MKKYISIFLISALWFTSCKVDDVLQDPNNPALDQVDADLLLNGIQQNVDDFFEGMSIDGMSAVRMVASFPRGGTYETFYQPQDFDEDWIDAYSDILFDINNLIPITQELGFTTHTAIARIIRAYTLVTLVDFFGDVPFSEAFQGAANLNPGTDDAEALYNFAYSEVLSAIGELNEQEVSLPAVDFFYDNDEAKWERLAYTMLLKIDLQRRLVDNDALGRIQDLIDTAAFIGAGDDFKYDFSTNILNPDSRHAYFGENYDNGASIYMSNSFMAAMINDIDPRLRYYFYRQETTVPTDDAVNLPCSVEDAPAHYGPDDQFCAPGSYWGRDHIDNDGIPPDTGDRTVYGIYPVGGRFDLGDDEAVNQDTRAGAGGAGFHPIMMAHFVNFMLAEYYIITGDDAAARVELEAGLDAALADVRAFTDASPEASRAETFETTADYTTNANNYRDGKLADYDAATSDDERLQVVMTEYWKAAFGNGIEPFNFYRRTGFPNNLQPALNPDAGGFFRSMPYPANVINRNSSIGSKGSVTVKVFWDNNPDDFIN